jgi:hypothetical protein
MVGAQTDFKVKSHTYFSVASGIRIICRVFKTKHHEWGKMMEIDNSGYLAVRGYKEMIHKILYMFMGRDSSVGIATCYGLDGPGIESRWGGKIFRTLPDRPWFPPNLLYNGHRLSCPGVKRPRRGVDHSPRLAPRLRISGAIPLLTLYAFMAWPETNLRTPLPISETLGLHGLF